MSSAAAPAVPAPHPLRDYALLADGERGALVGPRGDLAWLCFPRWHDDAVFAALLGGGSSYAVGPRGRYVWGGYYEPGGLIWRSRWATEDGIVESREALALPAGPRRAIVLRRVEALDAAAAIEVTLAAGAGFDRHGMARLRRGEDGAWRAELGEERMAWYGAEEAEVREGEGGKALALRFALEAGESRDLVLVLSAAGEDAEVPPARELWAATEEAWRERVPSFDQTLAPRDARHAYAVLCGLTSGDGGMVAAATTSLPERAKQGRSYDYRYAWLRDQAYAGQAVAAAGGQPLLDAAVGFVAERLLADGSQTAPAYTVTGERVPPERRLELPGYPGGYDVVGNRVHDQFQLDVFGEALLLFAAAARQERMTGDAWRAAEVAAAAIAERRHDAEAGIWELEPDLWTHSRLVCAAGLRAIAAQDAGGERSAGWLALSDAMLADASAHSLQPDGRWRRAPDDERVDAALLLAAVRGAVPVDDARSRATIAAVRAELAEDGYCYRYRADDRPLGQAEGAFLLCGFWLALAEAQAGEETEALRWFERTRAAAGPAGLLSEEFDVSQRQLRGNLPQAFVHALLLECAATLRRGG